MGESKENYQWDLGSERVNVISQSQPWRKNKKLKNINGTFILFHENVYLLSSPKYKHDVMLMMQLSSCLPKKKTQKLWTFTASLVANFFFFFLFCPTSFCIGLCLCFDLKTNDTIITHFRQTLTRNTHFFVHVSSSQKLWTFTASLVANFFFFFLFCPTSFCIGLLYTYIFETCKHWQG